MTTRQPEFETPTSRSYDLAGLSLLLMLGAFIALAVGFRHRSEVDSRRGRHGEEHGPIDVPDALYFDSMAVSVRLPVLLVWLSCHTAAAILFSARGGELDDLGRRTFWLLWLASWLGVIVLTFV